MGISPQQRLDWLWWISVPYLIVLPLSLGLLMALTGASGWAIGHGFGLFILLGLPLVCVSAGWLVTITYRIFVSHTIEPDLRTKVMFHLAGLITLAWGLYAATGS